MAVQPPSWRRRDVEFKARDGVTLRGWLYCPAAIGPAPCVITTHGFTALIDQGLAAFAETFARAGFAVLVYDHRNYGRSGGQPRLETNPFQQMHDMRDSITYATLLPEIDENRIGVWGTSYSGGHALVIGAVDRRVRCVVSVVPAVSGGETVRRLVGESNLTTRHARMNAARKSEMTEGVTSYQPHAAPGESLEWFEAANQNGGWENKVSTVSHDMVEEYEPGDYIARITPTPLLMIVADNDMRCFTDLQLAAYEKASEPKRLVVFKGGHYDAYTREMPRVAAESCAWFAHHLTHQVK